MVGTLLTFFVIPVVYTYLSLRVFIEADDETIHATGAPALPAPKYSAPAPAE